MWEELDHGLDTQGVHLDVYSRIYGKQGGGVGKERREFELVMGLDVIQHLGVKPSADGKLSEGFKLRWGTGNNQGTIQIVAMTDQTLPGLEIRGLKKGTVFKMKTTKFPRLSHPDREYDREELTWVPSSVTANAIDIYLPEDFFVDELQETETQTITITPVPVKALPSPTPTPAPQVSTAAASLASQHEANKKPLMATIPELEAEAYKRIPDFEVTVSGRYRVGKGQTAQEYMIGAILNMVNARRQRAQLGPMVID